VRVEVGEAHQVFRASHRGTRAGEEASGLRQIHA
jgi:hypothetical protein